MLKVKFLRRFIPENIVILFYTWWIVFLVVGFLLEVIFPQHFDGVFHCLLAAIFSCREVWCYSESWSFKCEHFFPNLKLLASSYYLWNFEISRWCAWVSVIFKWLCGGRNGSFPFGHMPFSPDIFLALLIWSIVKSTSPCNLTSQIKMHIKLMVSYNSHQPGGSHDMAV